MADVLLVDDDGNVLLTMAMALRRRGHEVTVARNGWQALMLLSRHPFAVLVSDVRMPGMSGLELAARARNLECPPRIILTSAQNIEVGAHLAEAFLPKPLDVDELSLLLSNGTPPDNHLAQGRQDVQDAKRASSTHASASSASDSSVPRDLSTSETPPPDVPRKQALAPIVTSMFGAGSLCHGQSS